MLRFYHMTTSTKILIGAFVILVVALLVGQRLGFEFTGGSGFHAPLSLQRLETVGTVTETRDNISGPVSDNPPRGATIATDVASRAKFSQGSLTLWMSEDTVLQINKLETDSVEFRIIKGRIIISNGKRSRQVTVITDKTQTTFTEADISIVNYDFLQKVSVIPLSGSFTASVDGGSSVTTPMPVDISEAEATITFTSFSPSGSAAQEFYAWFNR